jgi:hypothetical protein
LASAINTVLNGTASGSFGGLSGLAGQAGSYLQQLGLNFVGAVQNAVGSAVVIPSASGTVTVLPSGAYTVTDATGAVTASGPAGSLNYSTITQDLNAGGYNTINLANGQSFVIQQGSVAALDTSSAINGAISTTAIGADGSTINLSYDISSGTYTIIQ